MEDKAPCKVVIQRMKAIDRVLAAQGRQGNYKKRNSRHGKHRVFKNLKKTQGIWKFKDRNWISRK